MNPGKFSMVRIPNDLDFDDLHLEFNPDSGALEFDWAPLRTIIQVNVGFTLDDEAAVVDLIGAWYGGLRVNGYRHEVAERCLQACEAYRAFGSYRVFAGPDTCH